MTTTGLSLERKAGLPQALRVSLTFVAILFVLRVAEAVFGVPLNQFGIVPRTIHGLVGILVSPLLHADSAHLIANAIPLLVLMILLFANRAYRPIATFAFIWLVSGLGLWLIGRGNAIHIGASSIIFGLAAFLIVAAFRLKSVAAAAVALLVFLFYGGIFYGVLPANGPISWEGHLCGAIAGVWRGIKVRK